MPQSNRECGGKKKNLWIVCPSKSQGMGVTDTTAQSGTPFPIYIPFPWVALGWLGWQGAQPKAGVKHPVSCDDEVLAQPEHDNIPAVGPQLRGKREIPQRWILCPPAPPWSLRVVHRKDLA